MEVKEYKYWKWKSTVVDFSKLEEIDEKGYGIHRHPIWSIFRFLPLPFDADEVHEWYNGGWSTEYNNALGFAIQCGLAEWVDIPEEDEE